MINNYENERSVTRRYSDPLDAIWTATLHRLGFRLERSEHVYASVDENRVLTIGASCTLDADDCLAQMILHELCHALIQTDEERQKPDWGLRNTDDSDRAKEHATLRLQAALTERHGLRWVFAPTTNFRAYYDALPIDPLSVADAAESESVLVASNDGWTRATEGPWSGALNDALVASEIIVRATTPFCSAMPSEPATNLPLVFGDFDEKPRKNR
ncbi:MAG: hypothetical protein R3A47_04810 [Polyangiales bacterium]